MPRENLRGEKKKDGIKLRKVDFPVFLFDAGKSAAVVFPADPTEVDDSFRLVLSTLGATCQRVGAAADSS